MQAVQCENCMASVLPRGLCHEHGEDLKRYELCLFNEQKEFYNVI